MNNQNAVYAQSGGVTAVINVSAVGVIHACRAHSTQIGKLYAAENGIVGVLQENLIDTSCESDADILALKHTPGGAFGSCRYKMKSLEQNQVEYKRLIEVFHAHNVGYFFYNGGNDSADTCLKVAQIAQELGYPLKAIHIPKTIDNDLVVTDNCPGFGSAAKYVATSIREAGFDLASMCSTSTQVFILEVMGRHAGWVAAAAGIASTSAGASPHMILFPEVAFDQDEFLAIVAACIRDYGYCVMVASEGVKTPDGKLLTSSSLKDAFGHQQLGGVAATLAEMVQQNLRVKCHYAISDYLQRSARHIASLTDVEQAYAVGSEAVKLALAGHNAVMPYIRRIQSVPYSWDVSFVPLVEVANKEKFMPRDFIDDRGFHITEKCREYIEPLIQGEDYPPYVNGLPQYVKLKCVKVAKKLAEFVFI